MLLAVCMFIRHVAWCIPLGTTVQDLLQCKVYLYPNNAQHFNIYHL